VKLVSSVRVTSEAHAKGKDQLAFISLKRANCRMRGELLGKGESGCLKGGGLQDSCHSRFHFLNFLLGAIKAPVFVWSSYSFVGCLTYSAEVKKS